MKEITISSAQLAELSRIAEAAAANSYSPYSHFSVGAAILLESGETVSGCNVENASYRLTMCAEQTAIAAAVALHGPEIRIRAVAVYNLNRAACTPCGACRQTMAEFAGADTIIVFPNGNGETATRTLGELLPAAFDLCPA